MYDTKTYLLSVCAAAIICALANGFFAKNPSMLIGKMMTGLFLMLTVLQPIYQTDGSLFQSIIASAEFQGSEAVEQGKSVTEKAMAQIIKEKTTAYILQKANSLNAEISVEVFVSSDTLPVPDKVRISGNIAPYAKQQLQIMLTKELGISKENQIWT